MLIETEQKALQINLDDSIYGAFAEIGAGQEVARHFFQVGAAAGTIAKTMSAYDKTVSDEIYGAEAKGRYVCESRLYKMLQHEFELMEKRLRAVRPDQTFFAFADTVSAINFQKTNKGDGWLGLRFQLAPQRGPNELVVHVRLLDQDNRLQQQAIGILGVNMIFGCYRHPSDPETLIKSLMDNLNGRISIDLVRLHGPDFEGLDNRLLCLWAVKNGLSPVMIFGPEGHALHAGEFLYRKAILVARGSYRPPTLVQQDMVKNAYDQFRAELDIDPEKTFFLSEITLDNLRAGGQIDEKDFLDRAGLLSALGQTVIISNCVQHKYLISYFSEYKITRIGLLMGARKLLNIINDTYRDNIENLLDAFGEIFLRNVRFYIYPAQTAPGGQLLTAETLPVPEGMHFLYHYLLATKHIVDIAVYNPDNLHIFHKTVLAMIQSDNKGWEEMVPPAVAVYIKTNHLFNYNPEKQPC